MTKFQKRVTKLSRDTAHALVVGSAFGILDQILEIYGTVFIVNASTATVKAKNLIYKENFTKLDHIHNISSIFVDVDQLGNLDKIEVLWKKHNSCLFIEGGDRIQDHRVKILQNSGWECTSLQGTFQVWEHYR